MTAVLTLGFASDVVVLQQLKKDSELPVYTGDLPSGIYFVSVISGNKRETFKLVKE